LDPVCAYSSVHADQEPWQSISTEHILVLTLPPVFKWIAAATVFSLAWNAAHAVSLTHSAAAEHLVENMPLAFERNQGQVDPSIRFISRGLGYNAYLLPGGIALTLQKSTPNEAASQPRRADILSSRLDMRFVGANTDPILEPIAPLPYKVNYFTGSDQARQTSSQISDQVSRPLLPNWGKSPH